MSRCPDLILSLHGLVSRAGSEVWAGALDPLVPPVETLPVAQTGTESGTLASTRRGRRRVLDQQAGPPPRKETRRALGLERRAVAVTWEEAPTGGAAAWPALRPTQSGWGFSLPRVLPSACCALAGFLWRFPGASAGKEPSCNQETGLRSLGREEGHGSPLQYSRLENPVSKAPGGYSA